MMDFKAKRRRTFLATTLPRTLARLICLAPLLACLGASPRVGAETDSGLTYFQTARFAEAFQSWSEAAMSGDAKAALYVGVLYDTGLGVAMNRDLALDWYRRAAQGGNATAMFNAGVMCDAGIGRPRDLAEAADWYGQAAAKGFGRAEYNLALMAEAGSGVPLDKARAAELYRAAARDGVRAARTHLLQLGLSYDGEVGRKDDVAMGDFEQAQRILLARGPTEAAQAAALFRKAAEAGNALAEYDLGYCYEHGIGVPSDMSEAISWYARAASQANSAAIREIAEAGMRSLREQVSQRNDGESGRQ